MTAQVYLPEEILINGLEAMMTALGPVETARFLNLPRQRSSDYVEWHRRWQAGLDPQRFFDEVLALQRASESWHALR